MVDFKKVLKEERRQRTSESSIYELMGIETPPGEDANKSPFERASEKETPYQKAERAKAPLKREYRDLFFGGEGQPVRFERTPEPPKVFPLIGASEDQATALEAAVMWACGHGERGHKQTLRMGGYAGTGKTTLIKAIKAQAPLKTVVSAFTGKAVSVLQAKGIPAQTLHSLLYQPAGEAPDDYKKAQSAWRELASSIIEANDNYASEADVENGFLRGDLPNDPVFRAWVTERNKYKQEEKSRWKWKKKPDLGDTKLVIVDEASMVNDILHSDLLSMNTRVMYVGDHGQLEPIGRNPGLMKNPDIRLERIHRQAEGSGIIQFAHHLRGGGTAHNWRPSSDVRLTTDPGDLDGHDVVICGYNRTRVQLNHILRNSRGYKGSHVQVGERVICLANNRELGVHNGLMAEVLEVRPTQDPNVVDLRTKDDAGAIRWTPALKSQFGAERKPENWFSTDITLWDWGYAVTCHKAQGSEWDRVAVVEQIHKQWGDARWRYTAVTRAARHVTYKLPGRLE